MVFKRCLSIIFVCRKRTIRFKKEIFRFSDYTGSLLQLFSNLDSSVVHRQKLLENYMVNEHISMQLFNKPQNVFQLKNQPILVVDSLGFYNLSMQRSIILLCQSPKINLTRLIAKLNPKKIIADGSNFKSYINRWKITCRKQKTPFYYTGQNGAYILSKH